jgi:hypothetical protein
MGFERKEPRESAAMPAEKRLDKAQSELVALSWNLDIQFHQSEPHEHKCIHRRNVVGSASSVLSWRR